MSKQKSKKGESGDSPEFVRKTVTIPAEVADFADKRAAGPEHAGNLSSYVRSLILRDREQELKAA